MGVLSAHKRLQFAYEKKLDKRFQCDQTLAYDVQKTQVKFLSIKRVSCHNMPDSFGISFVSYDAGATLLWLSE